MADPVARPAYRRSATPLPVLLPNVEERSGLPTNVRTPVVEHHLCTLEEHDPPELLTYCSFAYSAFACFRIKLSGSAPFHSVRKS